MIIIVLLVLCMVGDMREDILTHQILNAKNIVLFHNFVNFPSFLSSVAVQV